MDILFILATVTPTILICFYFYRKNGQETKNWKTFCEQTNKDPVFSLLLNRAKKENYVIEFGSLHGSGMSVRSDPNIILIDSDLIGDFLKGKVAIEIIRFTFAHELGHPNAYQIEEQILAICPPSRKPSIYCLLVELLASKRALEILKEIGENPENYRNTWLFEISFSIYDQCQECFERVAEEKNCPKQEEVKRTGSQIEEMLGIK